MKATMSWLSMNFLGASKLIDKVLNLRADSKRVSGVSDFRHGKKIFIIHLRLAGGDGVFEMLAAAMWISD